MSVELPARLDTRGSMGTRVVTHAQCHVCHGLTRTRAGFKASTINSKKIINYGNIKILFETDNRN